MAYGAIEAMGGAIERVDITDLRQNTFFAALVLRRPEGGLCVIDARPSDALALGLRCGCPIRVAESVLEHARTDTSGPDDLPPELPPDMA